MGLAYNIVASPKVKILCNTVAKGFPQASYILHYQLILHGA